MTWKLRHFIVTGVVLAADSGQSTYAQNSPAPVARRLQQQSAQVPQAEASDSALPPAVESAEQPEAEATPAPPAEPSEVPQSPTSKATGPVGPLPPMRPSTAPKPSTTPQPVRHRASVGGIVVDGLSDAEAISKLQRALASQLRQPVALWDGQRNHTLTREELGATIPVAKLLREAQRIQNDVPVRFEVDLSRVRRALTVLSGRINRKPSRLSRVALDANKKVRSTTQSEVIELAVRSSTRRVQQALEAQPPRSRVTLVVTRETINTEPEVALRETPRGPWQTRYLLASFSTPYDASIRGRTNNLRMAAKLVNGTVVPPGKIFSANRAIGPRRAADGWREAKMFVNGQVVSGVGSGICQCSSTIYNAALLAGLPIIERHPHSFRVVYVPPSRDAAIYWGSKDMRFLNNTNGPILVQTFLRGGRFHARLYGTEPKRNQVEVVSRTLSRRGGTRSEAYRIVSTASGTSREQLSRDYYKPMP